MWIFLILLVVAVIVGKVLASAILHVVRAREAVLVCDRVTGRVRQLTIGPSLVPVIPWLEETRALDLSQQMTRLGTTNVMTLNSMPLAAATDVLWSIEPTLLRQADLDQILPFLDDLATPIKAWTDYLLHAILARYSLTTILQTPRAHEGLEHLLSDRLQARVAILGVRIHTIRLICRLEPTVLNARIAAEARAQELGILATVLGPQNQLESLMRLEMLESFRRSGSQLVTAFDIPESAEHDGSNGHGRMQFVVSPR